MDVSFIHHRPILLSLIRALLLSVQDVARQSEYCFRPGLMFFGETLTAAQCDETKTKETSATIDT